MLRIVLVIYKYNSIQYNNELILEPKILSKRT